MKGPIAYTLCAVSARSYFDKLSMKSISRFVLSRAYAPSCAPKGESGTRPMTATDDLRSTRCCEAA